MNYLSLMRSNGFWGGIAVGAVATYVLTNKEVQNTAFRVAASFVNGLRGSVEEAKERFQDAEAEIQAEAEVDQEAAKG